MDRSTSIPSRDRRVISENVRMGQDYPCEGTCPQGTSTSNRRDYLEDSSEDNRSYRSVKDTPMKEEDHPMKEGIPTEIEDFQEEEDHKTMGGPQIDMEDTLVKEDPLREEDPLTMEGHLIEMEDHQDALIEEDPQDLEDLLDQ